MRVIQTHLSLNICWLQAARLDSRTWRAPVAATVSWRRTCNGLRPECGARHCIPRLTLSLLPTLKNNMPLKRGCPVSLVCRYDLLYYTKAACCIGQMVKTMKYAFVRVVRNRPIGLQAIEANSSGQNSPPILLQEMKCWQYTWSKHTACQCYYMAVKHGHYHPVIIRS